MVCALLCLRPIDTRIVPHLRRSLDLNSNPGLTRLSQNLLSLAKIVSEFSVATGQ